MPRVAIAFDTAPFIYVDFEDDGVPAIWTTQGIEAGWWEYFNRNAREVSVKDYETLKAAVARRTAAQGVITEMVKKLSEQPEVQA